MLCAIYYEPYTRPFARRVLSHFHTYVLPSSPHNYNALYRTISRCSFSLDPGGFRGVSSCVLAVCICTRCIVAMLRWAWMLAVYIRGGLVFFSRPKRRVCGGRQNLCIFFAFRVIYKYIYILTRKARRYARFAICKQTDVSHANRRHWAACVSAGRASDGVRCVAAVCVACGYQRGASVYTGRAPPPPLGHLAKERRHSPNFFLFF